LAWLWLISTAKRNCTFDTDANRNYDAVGEKGIPFGKLLIRAKRVQQRIAADGVSLVAFVLEIVIVTALTSPRLRTLGKALATSREAGFQDLHALANHALLLVSIQSRLIIGLGIVFLMTVKPGLVGSLVTLGLAIAIGIAASLPFTRRLSAQEKPVT